MLCRSPKRYSARTNLSAQLIRCPVAAKHVPRRCWADDVTFMSICPHASEQSSVADAQIFCRCWSTVSTMRLSCPGHVAQVPDTAKQGPPRYCAVVLKLLCKVTCAAEQLNRRFSTIDPSKLRSLNDAGPLVFYTVVQVSWRWSVCDLFLRMGFDDCAQLYRQFCTVSLTLLYTWP
jgi:hypothetical protein